MSDEFDLPPGSDALSQLRAQLHDARRAESEARELAAEMAAQLASSGPRPSIRFKWEWRDGDRGESITFQALLDDLADDDVREGLVVARNLVARRAAALRLEEPSRPSDPATH